MDVPPQFVDLLDGPHTAVLTTLLPDGSPHASPVWFLRQGDEIIVSSRAGQQKHFDAVRDPRAALTVVDPVNPMRYVEVRGAVVVEDDPTCAARDAVVRKHGYADGSAFDPPDVRRVVLRIQPHRIVGR
jgi:PPOX class probable F420-dependent enzyme